MEADRKVIGLTQDSQAFLEQLQAKDWFSEGQDIARFCLAYAIKVGPKPGSTTGVDTRWSISGFDQTGEIQALVCALFPDNSAPVRAIESFVNEGLRLVNERLIHGGDTLADLME